MTKHTFPVALVAEGASEDEAWTLLYDALMEVPGVLAFATIEGISPEVKVEVS